MNCKVCVLGDENPCSGFAACNEACREILIEKSDELLAANAPSPSSASRPFALDRVQVSPLSSVSQNANLPLTGSPRSSPSLSKRFKSIASQNPSLSGFLNTSFQVWQPSVVL